MKKNVGNTDRIVRFVAALVLAVLYFTVVPNIWLIVIAVILAVTAFVNYCPIWAVLKVDTKGK